MHDAHQRPTVFTVCGLPGSGKTTLARRIEEEHGAICLSADALVLALLGPDLDVAEFPRYRARAWEQHWSTALRALQLGISVVLDFSFYRRSEREDFRARAATAGADFRMFYLDCSPEVLRGRLERRNRARSEGAFRVSDDELAALSAQFEAPTHEEEPQVVRVHAEVELP